MSILVSQDRYAEVSDWINGRHLGGRIVYYRVPRAVVAADAGARTAVARPLFDKLEVKDSVFADWLDRELVRRAGHECVDTMDEFRRASLALTRGGQVKSGGGRHEKNDTTRIDDRASYVLGWSNELKVEALVDRAQAIQGRLQKAIDTQHQLRSRFERAAGRQAALGKLEEFGDWADLDW